MKLFSFLFLIVGIVAVAGACAGFYHQWFMAAICFSAAVVFNPKNEKNVKER